MGIELGSPIYETAAITIASLSSAMLRVLDFTKLFLQTSGITLETCHCKCLQIKCFWHPEQHQPPTEQGTTTTGLIFSTHFLPWCLHRKILDSTHLRIPLINTRYKKIEPWIHPSSSFPLATPGTKE